MADYFIHRSDAEHDLLDAAAFLGERISSIDGKAEAMSAVVPRYLAIGNVDLAAELANTVDDPFTRERLLIEVAQKCAEIDDDEYALQLADAIEDPGLRNECLERIGGVKAGKGEIDKALDVGAEMIDADGVLGAVAKKQYSTGATAEALSTIDRIEHAGAAVTAYLDIASDVAKPDEPSEAVGLLDRALESASIIEHQEEQARAYIDIGNLFLDLNKGDRAIETFDKAKSTAERIDNMHRDSFLSLAAQGFAHSGSFELADRALDLVADKTQIASCLLGFARAYWKKEERAEAIEALEEAHAVLKSQHERETRDHKQKFRLFTTISGQFAGFEKAERAIETAETIEDEGQRTAALSQVAAVLTLRREDEAARDALRAITEDGDRVFALIGMSDAREKKEDREGAAAFLTEALELTETVPQLTVRASGYVEIGRRLSYYGSMDADRAFSGAMDTIIAIRDESAKVATMVALREAMGERDSREFAARAL